MAKIKSPNPKYNGVSASLQFANGVAETEDPWLIGWFKNRGYKVVEEENAEPKEPKHEDGKPIDKMTHEELDAFAAEKGVPEDQYPKSGKREEKIAAIQDFIKDPEGE